VSGGAGLIRGDALTIPLRDESVDLIVTSPPYFALRSYTDGGEHYDGQIGSEPTPQAFLEALWAVTAECKRVLKPSGSLWVNLGDKYAGGGGYNQDSGGIRAKSLMGLPWRYAIGCIDDLGLILRAEVVWSKANSLPESVTDRVRRSHEQWFMFTKEPRYFAAVDEVREAYSPDASERREKYGRIYEDGYAAGNRNDANRGGPMGKGGASENPLGKLPGSVWTIPSEPLRVPEHIGVDHFAAFPQEWPRRIILGWSPSGICEACGEGRRPVADRRIEGDGKMWGEPGKIDPNGESGTEREGGFNDWRAGQEIGRRVVSITGYACACPTPDAPTRPAVVLDPFGGTGTVAMVARALGRYGVHIDLSADYLRLARWRVFESGHASKALAKTNAERQLDLFGGAA
jgi:DNA modification methylase